MQSALEAIVGPEARGLSANVVSRLKRRWEGEYKDWCTRSVADEWVYIWADGIYSGLRGDDGRLCCLVIIGVNSRGQKHFLAIEDGVRESKQSWREVLLSLKQRGMNQSPKLAIGDGALGFWAALEEVYPETRTQRCWMHKTGNVLNYLPKSVQDKAKQALHDIWMAEGREEAERAFDNFEVRFEAKYPKAVACLSKDRESLLAFYDFPAEHWTHIRTTNVIESSFATIRHRSNRAKGCVTRITMLTMIYKMGICAEDSWRKLRGFRYLAMVIEGVRFKDGIVMTEDDKAAA
jgi:transposase-like protein